MVDFFRKVSLRNSSSWFGLRREASACVETVVRFAEFPHPRTYVSGYPLVLSHYNSSPEYIGDTENTGVLDA